MVGLVSHFSSVDRIGYHCLKTRNDGEIFEVCTRCCPISFVAVGITFWALLQVLVWASKADTRQNAATVADRLET